MFSSSSNVLAEIPVKLYHAKFSGTEYDWQYFNQRGMAQFCQKQTGGMDTEHAIAGEKGENRIITTGPELSEASYGFRLLDETTGRILWTFSIPDDFVYRIDKPFFHFFNGRSRMWGFLFEKDEDAQTFAQTVHARLPSSTQVESQLKNLVYKPGDKYSGRSPSIHSQNSLKSRFGRLRTHNASTPVLASPHQAASIQKVTQQPMTPSLTTSIVSLPQTNTFVHLGHIGLGEDGLMECSDGIDPSWSDAIMDLQTHKSRNFAPEALKRKVFIMNGLRVGMKKFGPATVRSGCL